MSRPRSPASQVERLCKAALAQGLRRYDPTVMIDERGYVSDTAHNLVSGVKLADFEADLQKGKGSELKSKFRAAHSSSALAVNTFAPFKRVPAELWIDDMAEFASVEFECQCSAGILGRTPPHLDLVAGGESEILAVESKCTEFLRRHVASFAPAYEQQIQDGRRLGPWFAEMMRLLREPRSYRWLNADQLIKHAFGLAHRFHGRRVVLVYLYWQPLNPDEFNVFEEHAKEIEQFSLRVRGGFPRFQAMSYPELWSLWVKHYQSTSMQNHLRYLRLRYELAIESMN